MSVADIPDEPLEGLEGLQLKCNQVTDESLECTRRMMDLCSEAKDQGIKTLVALDDQGEQIDKIEGGLDSINADMGLAEKALKSMDLAFGIFPKFWKKSEGFKEDKEVWGEVKGGSGGGAKPAASVEVGEGAFVARITNDDREEEMEDNMQQIGAMVGNLRNMANDMGSEIGRQNDQLDRINKKAESDQSRVKMANEKASNLLK